MDGGGGSGGIAVAALRLAGSMIGTCNSRKRRATVVKRALAAGAYAPNGSRADLLGISGYGGYLEWIGNGGGFVKSWKSIFKGMHVCVCVEFMGDMVFVNWVGIRD